MGCMAFWALQDIADADNLSLSFARWRACVWRARALSLSLSTSLFRLERKKRVLGTNKQKPAPSAMQNVSIIGAPVGEGEVTFLFSR